MDDIKRTHAASKKKIHDVAKKNVGPDKAPGKRDRASPGGRRLAELRKRKETE